MLFEQLYIIGSIKQNNAVGGAIGTRKLWSQILCNSTLNPNSKALHIVCYCVNLNSYNQLVQDESGINGFNYTTNQMLESLQLFESMLAEFKKYIGCVYLIFGNVRTFANALVNEQTLRVTFPDAPAGNVIDALTFVKCKYLAAASNVLASPYPPSPFSSTSWANTYANGNSTAPTTAGVTTSAFTGTAAATTPSTTLLTVNPTTPTSASSSPNSQGSQGYLSPFASSTTTIPSPSSSINNIPIYTLFADLDDSVQMKYMLQDISSNEDTGGNVFEPKKTYMYTSNKYTYTYNFSAKSKTFSDVVLETW